MPKLNKTLIRRRLGRGRRVPAETVSQFAELLLRKGTNRDQVLQDFRLAVSRSGLVLDESKLLSAAQIARLAGTHAAVTQELHEAVRVVPARLSLERATDEEEAMIESAFEYIVDGNKFRTRYFQNTYDYLEFYQGGLILTALDEPAAKRAIIEGAPDLWIAHKQDRKVVVGHRHVTTREVIEDPVPVTGAQAFFDYVHARDEELFPRKRESAHGLAAWIQASLEEGSGELDASSS